MKLAGSIQNAARILITLEGFMGGAWAECGSRRQDRGEGRQSGEDAVPARP